MHAEKTTAIESEMVHDIIPTPTRAQPLAVVNDSSPGGMIAYAMQSGASIADLKELYALKQEWDRDEARKAYHLALAAFKAEPLAIEKDKLVSIKHKDGNGVTEYRHATLGNVVATIAPALGRHRLSHSWGVRREGDRVYVTCKLTHALGHSEEITLDGPLDTSGSKNNIQAVGSTITYLERYTLLAITGLATEDQDDDGRGSGSGGESPQTISEDQAAKLQDALEAAGRSLDRFKAWLQVEKLTDLRLDRFDVAMREASKPRQSKGVQA
jgi:hypothetical protein